MTLKGEGQGEAWTEAEGDVTIDESGKSLLGADEPFLRLGLKSGGSVVMSSSWSGGAMAR